MALCLPRLCLCLRRSISRMSCHPRGFEPVPAWGPFRAWEGLDWSELQARPDKPLFRPEGSSTLSGTPPDIGAPLLYQACAPPRFWSRGHSVRGGFSLKSRPHPHPSTTKILCARPSRPQCLARQFLCSAGLGLSLAFEEFFASLIFS